MAQEKRPQLRIDPQQFAQEVAAEIAADLSKQRSAQQSAPHTPFALSNPEDAQQD